MSDSGHSAAEQTAAVKRNMGPVLAGTLVTGDLDATVAAYTGFLEMSVAGEGDVSAGLANGWPINSGATANTCGVTTPRTWRSVSCLPLLSTKVSGATSEITALSAGGSVLMV